MRRHVPAAGSYAAPSRNGGVSGAAQVYIAPYRPAKEASQETSRSPPRTSTSLPVHASAARLRADSGDRATDSHAPIASSASAPGGPVAAGVGVATAAGAPGGATASPHPASATNAAAPASSLDLTGDRTARGPGSFGGYAECTAFRVGYHSPPAGSPAMFQLHDTVGVMRRYVPGPTIPTRSCGPSATP
jgi:hypothetical protein